MKVKDLRLGERITGKFAVIEKLYIKDYRMKKGKFFVLRVGDETGETMLKYWGNGDSEKVEALFSEIEEGCVIDVEGICSLDEYTGRKSINIDEEAGYRIRMVNPGEYDAKEYIPRVQTPIQTLIARFNSLIKRINNPHIKAILSEVFEETIMKKFVESPCSMRHNHAYLGGLLEHTINIGELCCTIHAHYPELDLDLMIAGALLRNLGKVNEFELGTKIERTDEGNMLGHAVLSDEMVMDAVKNIPGLPEDLILKLRHIVLASGKRDWGTLVPPKTAEALAVYLAEQCDEMLNTFMKIQVDAASSGYRWAYSRELGYAIFAQGE